MFGNSTQSTAQRDVRPRSLADQLASTLPKGHHFGLYHISTPPTVTDALVDAPPGEKPDRTYVEKHFLALSIDADTTLKSDKATSTTAVWTKRASPGADEPKNPWSPDSSSSSKGEVLVVGLEVYLFTTAYSTTIFVSKADSTGYLQLLNLDPGTPSPIREVCTTFIFYLITYRRRENVQTVVSLFARAQDQYLFPLSAENENKHVLSDYGLVKWWCRVLNPLLGGDDSGRPFRRNQWGEVKGYLTVPGLDTHETRALLPKTPESAASWAVGDPMMRISHYVREFDWVPLRCLISNFPDDPKSRFRDELDEEAADGKQGMGLWKSVKTLEQFWTMMAFRQECSSGRLTGFIWVILDPKEAKDSSSSPTTLVSTSSFSYSAKLSSPSSSFDSSMPPSTPPRRRAAVNAVTTRSSPLKAGALDGSPGRVASSMLGSFLTTETRHKMETKEQLFKKKKKLTGPIIPRQPRIKTEQGQRNYVPKIPTSTAYYTWPTEGRGQRIVDGKGYKRTLDLLLNLEFSTLNKAVASTQRWLSEARCGAAFGQSLLGRREVITKSALDGQGAAQPAGTVNSLTGLVRKKAKSNDASVTDVM